MFLRLIICDCSCSEVTRDFIEVYNSFREAFVDETWSSKVFNFVMVSFLWDSKAYWDALIYPISIYTSNTLRQSLNFLRKRDKIIFCHKIASVQLLTALAIFEKRSDASKLQPIEPITVLLREIFRHQQFIITDKNILKCFKDLRIRDLFQNTYLTEKLSVNINVRLKWLYESEILCILCLFHWLKSLFESLNSFFNSIVHRACTFLNCLNLQILSEIFNV